MSVAGGHFGAGMERDLVGTQPVLAFGEDVPPYGGAEIDLMGLLADGRKANPANGRRHCSAASSWPRNASSFGASRGATSSMGSVVDRLRFST